MTLLTIIIMDFLAGMEFDLFVPSFPQLQEAFNLSTTMVEALISVNFLGYCLSLFCVGELADRYGRKPIILAGLLIFIVGSIFCLWPGTYLFMILGRFLQGIGIAAPAILSFLIIADTCILKKQQSLIAMLNSAMNIAVAIAPVVGSYITKQFHWRGNFWALLSLGLLTYVLTQFCIADIKQPHLAQIDPRVGYLNILKFKPLLLLMLCILILFVPYWIFVGISPLLYIKDLNVSLAHFGFYQGLFAFVFAIGSMLYGIFLNMTDFKQRSMLKIGLGLLVLSLISVLVTTTLNVDIPLWITLAFLPFVIAQIIPTTLLYPLCLDLISNAKGKISAIIQGGRLLFSALGLMLMGHFYNGSFRNIGIMICLFIFSAAVALVFVIGNSYLMNYSSFRDKKSNTDEVT